MSLLAELAHLSYAVMLMGRLRFKSERMKPVISPNETAPPRCHQQSNDDRRNDDGHR